MRFVCLLLLLLACRIAPALAQSMVSLPAPADTIGITRQRFIFSTATTYSFHAAQQLSGLQVAPLLTLSPDETINRLVRRSKRRYHLAAPLIIGSYGLLIGATRAIAVNAESGLAAGLTLGSVVVVVDGAVLSASAPRPMWRAVRRYNQLLTTPTDEYAYARPRPVPVSPNWLLTEADTIHRQPEKLGSRYMYRGIQVVPDVHLQVAMQSVQDPFIAEGIRQNRVTRGLAGLVGALSASFLTAYYLPRWINQAAGRNVPRTNSLVYVAAGGVVASFTIGRLTDRTTRRLVERYNQRLRAGQ